MKKEFKTIAICVCLLMVTFSGFSQENTSRWKVLFALGINSPDTKGFVPGYKAKPVNFPAITMGLQHMMGQDYGVKLDYSFNRFSADDNSEPFKTNYSRVNIQALYDLTSVFTFMPVETGMIIHSGVGMSFIKPLNDLKENKESYFNFIAGMEFHYRIKRTISLFVDGTLVFGKKKDFENITEGFGAFRGNLLNISAGVAISLSGCYYCNDQQ